MKILDEIEEKMDNVPNIEEMDSKSLTGLLEEVRHWKELLDEHEPKNPASESYEAWCDLHEEVEDLEDDILDFLEN